MIIENSYDLSRSIAWHTQDLKRKWGSIGSVDKINEMQGFFQEMEMTEEEPSIYADSEITALTIKKLNSCVDFKSPNKFSIGGFLILEAAKELGRSEEYAKEVMEKPNRNTAIRVQHILEKSNIEKYPPSQRDAFKTLHEHYVALNAVAKIIGQRIDSENRTFRGGINALAGFNTILQKLNELDTLKRSTSTSDIKEILVPPTKQENKNTAKRLRDEGNTYPEIKQAIGVSISTIKRWIK